VKECARRLFAGCSFVRLRFAIPSITAQASDPVGLLPRDRKEPEGLLDCFGGLDSGDRVAIAVRPRRNLLSSPMRGGEVGIIVFTSG
jgi:hypothetical protein